MRRFVFSAFSRRRVVVLTQNGKSVTVQKGVRFGNLYPPIEKQSPTEQLAAEEIDEEAASLTDKGFRELNQNEYDLFVEKLRISCTDDDLRRRPESRETSDPSGGNINQSGETCHAAIDVGLENGEDYANPQAGGSVSPGQRAARILLANTELKNCKTLELILAPSDLNQAIEYIAAQKVRFNIRTLILKTALPLDRSSPEEQESDDLSYSIRGDNDYDDGEDDWACIPCDCFAAAFPKVTHLVLNDGTWRLEGEQWKSLEEIDAFRLLTPTVRLDNLKRLKYGLSSFAHIESDVDMKPLSPAALLANRCPNLQSLDMDVDGDIDTFADILSSPLLDKITSLKIGIFNSSDLEQIYLLFTRFTAGLSRLESFTLVLEYSSLRKAEIDRLTAFPVPLHIEFT